MAETESEFEVTGIGLHILQAIGMTETELVDIMSYVMLACSVAIFLILFVIKAPYGRYEKTWVYMIGLHGKLAWFLQELPSFMVPVYIATFTDTPHASTAGKILLAIFLIHYFHRTFIFPFLLRGGKVTPLIAFLIAFIFCCYNGFMQAAHLLHTSSYQDAWLHDPRFIIGIALFTAGLLINIHSDHILRNLRKPGETGYKIPQGGLFNYVSGANFFGEILEWSGFAIASWSLPGFAFCVFTVSNIGHRAMHHHMWYLQKFDDYPKSRTALIPFLL